LIFFINYFYKQIIPLKQGAKQDERELILCQVFDANFFVVPVI